MSIAAIRNALRLRSILMARAFRAVFQPDGALSIDANHVLSDLREFCFAQKSTFDPDTHLMARREGRRDVFLRVSRYLNLDEDQVQKLMEIDDGE
ncbi:MAG: hypothetical protein ACTHOJ_07455 [Sphingomonas oligoaromativorans]